MSSALAISATTAVLQDLLTGVYSNLSSVLGGVTVSAVAPDIVQATVGRSETSPLQVNVFLHQVTINPAWRNQCLPQLAADGITPLSNPPLALDLHYLLTAYGGQDTEAEALLGYAILMLHMNPVLLRSQIDTVLTKLNTHPLASNPLSSVLITSALSEQVEMLKITPSTLGREEMAWIWTALKADYRPTFAFQVTVVLIQPQLPAAIPLPVLTRNITAQAEPPSQFGGQYAQLTAIQLPVGQSAPAQGDPVTVTGTGLGTTAGIVLSSQRLQVQYPAFAPATVSDTSVTFNVPIDAANLPAGVYAVSVTYTDTSGALETTNSLSMGVAPAIATPAPVVVSSATGVSVTLNCAPEVQSNQNVLLALGSTAVPAQPFTAPAANLSFQFPPLPAQSYVARLQVDGVDSPVAVNWNPVPPGPPVFESPMVVVP